MIDKELDRAAFEAFLNRAEQLFEQSDFIDDDVDETDLEDELDESLEEIK